jgi:hypothetical protein
VAGGREALTVGMQSTAGALPGSVEQETIGQRETKLPLPNAASSIANQGRPTALRITHGTRGVYWDSQAP